MYNGYNFYFDDGSNLLTFPITPSELSIVIGSNNKVIKLISEGEVNILKSPSLTEVKFNARFPMRQYPYARQFTPFETYWNKFKELKEQKKSFRFIVARTTPNGARTWDTNILVALENMEIKEHADEGDDVIISFVLKQYKAYGVKTIKLQTSTADSTPKTTSTSETPRNSNKGNELPTTHVVQKGDTLWGIAKKYYGDGSKYPIIYNTNKAVIEAAAKKYRTQSPNGYYIYSGTKLTIPKI